MNTSIPFPSGTPITVTDELNNVLGLSAEREIARQYAKAFDRDNGDTMTEYIDRAARDVYPSSLARLDGTRANFKRLVRHFLRERSVSV